MIQQRCNRISAVKTIRKKYSPEFKDQVLKRIAMDGVARVSKDMGIAESQLYSWKAKGKKGGNTLENQAIERAELAKLKREVHRLSEENAFLKKVAVYFTKSQE
ncbi:MAG: transposase [Gammaproteobacteria bacterium]